jgi:hypothetical protein
LYLNQHELISASSLVSGGTTISASDYFLEPVNEGPPYTRVELDLSSSASFSAGETHQRSIAITGVFGYTNETESTGTAAEAMDSSETGFDVSDSAHIGVGDIIVIDSERMIVTDKTMLDSGQNIGGNLTAAVNNVTVPVTTGSSYVVGEIILVDAERMLIVDIAGNNLVVKRAYDGTVLATHSTGADVYVPRTLTVTRGVLGTTAAAHDTSTSLARVVIPGPVRELATAYAIDNLLQKSSGYSRLVGSGENAKERTGQGVKDLEERVYDQYGRKGRIGVA